MHAFAFGFCCSIKFVRFICSGARSEAGLFSFQCSVALHDDPCASTLSAITGHCVVSGVELLHPGLCCASIGHIRTHSC